MNKGWVEFPPEKCELLSQVRHPDGRNFSLLPWIESWAPHPICSSQKQSKRNGRPGEEVSRKRPGTDGPLKLQGYSIGREGTAEEEARGHVPVLFSELRST